MYPVDEALDGLKELGAEAYRTDIDGDIVVSVDKKGNIVKIDR